MNCIARRKSGNVAIERVSQKVTSTKLRESGAEVRSVVPLTNSGGHTTAQILQRYYWRLCKGQGIYFSMFAAAPIDSGHVISTASFIDLAIDRMLSGYGLVPDLPNDLKINSGCYLASEPSMIMANASETMSIAKSKVSVQGSGRTFDHRNREKPRKSQASRSP